MIRIHVFNAHPKYKRRHAGFIALLRRVLKDEAVDAAAISVIFIGDRKMIKLNTDYLGHTCTTDVLSFPLSDDTRNLEGEVYVNLDQAKRQGKEFGVTFIEEESRLVVHGILHLIGYDDRTKSEKEKMTARENRYLIDRL
jgi:probable rRNA maturation factor